MRYLWFGSSSKTETTVWASLSSHFQMFQTKNVIIINMECSVTLHDWSSASATIWYLISAFCILLSAICIVHASLPQGSSILLQLWDAQSYGAALNSDLTSIICNFFQYRRIMLASNIWFYVYVINILNLIIFLVSRFFMNLILDLKVLDNYFDSSI